MPAWVANVRGATDATSSVKRPVFKITLASNQIAQSIGPSTSWAMILT